MTKSLLLAGSLLLSGIASADSYVEPKITHATYGDVNIVVPVTSGDSSVWQLKLANIQNAMNAAQQFGGHLSVKVVNYGPGLELLAQKNNGIAKAVNDLRARGVQFLVCDQTLKRMNLDFHTLNGVSDTDVVPAGFLEVGWLQTQQYKVDPMN
ncbi:DsrE family protein [Undibacterium oligocarboniphilum]|uniref:DsrE family protein n=1 Tax=Undibacterium oligocarboniphilum TaxID=666702 RepID=A0A850QN52_9BURK|nr:DsrE family protein [Undibacterium oligocarboniphilum]MBC3871556.1 DsrE family protein [Undibacterium oligocarboniphilum]NVO79085.1 DsrE family protein [Undibacterium oligocarboniphilum]